MIPDKVGDESHPPNNCSRTPLHAFGCFLYTRAAACTTSRAGFVVQPFVVRPPCQKQNWISMPELHGYGLHMGAGWAAESLAQGHLKVPPPHRAMTIPVPEAELNSHATIERLWVVHGFGLKSIEAPIRFKPWLFHCQKQNWTAMAEG